MAFGGSRACTLHGARCARVRESSFTSALLALGSFAVRRREESSLRFSAKRDPKTFPPSNPAHLPHGLVAVLLLELGELRLLCRDLLRQDALQRGQRSLTASQAAEDALLRQTVSSKEM